MGLINIRRDVSDAFYRYKMESLQTKIEGKGNGIKTVVVNLPSVAQSLARDPNYVIKYFAFELGAQTNTDPKDDRWIINGAHEAGKLQELLDGFIKKFVLCKKCHNPETDFVVLDPRILLDCKACGQRTDVDIRLKLSGFIIKHQGKGGKKDKAAKKAARRAKKENGGKEPNGNGSGGEDGSDNGSGANGDDQGSDDEFEKIQSAAPEVEVKDDDWAVDMSEEAVKARQAQLPDEFKQKLSLGDDEDGEAGGSTVYDEFGTWILDQATEKNGIDNVDSIEIYVKAKELGIESKPKTVIVLSQTLFDDNVLAQIPKRASMIKQIGTSEKHEKALLGGTERFVGSQLKEKPEILEKVVKILQLYYHHDLISEEIAIGWGTKASKKHVDIATSKKVRRAAEPFIKWLQEADEESSDEEEESDEE